MRAKRTRTTGAPADDGCPIVHVVGLVSRAFIPRPESPEPQIIIMRGNTILYFQSMAPLADRSATGPGQPAPSQRPHVPVQVQRQPLAELEAGFAGGAVEP